MAIDSQTPSAPAQRRDRSNADGRRGAASDQAVAPQGERVIHELDPLWEEYVGSRHPQLRERLIKRYLSLVKFMIGQMRINLPPGLDWDDILAYGTIGLIQAVDRFDPAVGVGFMTYATGRIRGSIIDSLRLYGGLPRQSAEKARRLGDAIEQLLQQLGRQPSDGEIANALGMTVEELRKIRTRLPVTLVSLDGPLGEDQGDQLAVVATLEDRASPNPEELMMAAETRRVLTAAIQELPEKEQKVLALYYRDQGHTLTLREVGRILGISGTRVQQIHVRAILRLRHLIK